MVQSHLVFVVSVVGKAVEGDAPGQYGGHQKNILGLTPSLAASVVPNRGEGG